MVQNALLEKMPSQLAILLRAINLGLLVGDAIAANKANLTLAALLRRGLVADASR